MLVQAFIAQAAVERFDVGILVGLARRDQEQLHGAVVFDVTRADALDLQMSAYRPPRVCLTA